jgi:signal transduction histidine kinase
LDPAVESTAYFVVAEAVTNARKHSSGKVQVLADCDESVLRVSVTDRGAGGAVVGAVGGLRGLVDRAAALGGSLEVTSPPGGGTDVHLELPLRGEGR